MPGMWELPLVAAPNGQHVLARYKHSITVTDYDVSIVELSRRPRGGVWIALEKVSTLPLTGLARKVLRSIELFSAGESKETIR